MKHTFTALLLCLAAVTTGRSQHMLGIANSNYAGTNGLYLNPSTIADSRYRLFVNLLGAGGHFTNNYMYYTGNRSILSSVVRGDADNLFDDSNVKERLNGKDKSAFMGAELRLPSFLVKLSDKHSIAFTNRYRLLVHGHGVAEDLARIIGYGTDSEQVQNVLFANRSAYFHANMFSESALSYGRVLFNQKEHFLKGGLTVKRMFGLYSGYMYSQGFNYQFEENNAGDYVFKAQNLNMGFGNSRNDADFEGDDFRDALPFGNSPGKGWGFDLGFTYEYRPDLDKFRYTMDGEEHLDNVNKYKFRVGMALTDLGSIKYDRPNQVASYSIVRPNVTLSSEQFEDADEDNIDDVFQNALGVQPSEKSTVIKSGLPAALNTTIDYHLTRKLYLNLTWVQNLRAKDAVSARQPSLLALTPRLETRGLEVSVPISLVNNFQDVAYGLAFKLGPWYIGSDNVGGLLGIGKAYGANVYTGFTFRVFKGRPKDRDRDGVSNKKDACADIAGLWAFKGCPDTDGDKVIDKDDACPDLAGLPELQGCPEPDADNDGVPDKADSCATVAGLAALNGCPDQDSDGIADHKDACPTVAGLAALNGCPDQDADGIKDEEDLCPTIKGLATLKGCPDTDGDGLADKDDECPDLAGSAALKGCPDKDGDSVADKADQCPEVPGTPENRGCPVIKSDTTVKVNAPVQLTEAEAKVLREAFDNLEFEVGKAEIKAASQESLNELAELLMERPTFRLSIAGHTDNQGKPAANLKLSKDRANAIKKFLVSKGVAADRIVAKGFGAAKPVASNKTPEGRQKNRRVEFQVIR